MRTGKGSLKSPFLHDDRKDSEQRVGCVDVDFPYEGAQLRLLCKFLWSSYDIRKAREEYAHPSPRFSRLFLFQRAGAELYLEGARIDLEPDAIYLLPAGQSFEIAYRDGSELLYSHVHACDSTMTPLFNGMKGAPQIKDAELQERMRGRWREGDRLRFQMASAEAVATFAESLKPAMKARARLCGSFRGLFETMQRTPPGKLRVEELAEAAGMTRAALSKSFARAMGVPLKTYITECQLNKACELLLFTGLSVAEVAERLGHEDPHYFHRRFKRLTGSTPAAYRRSHGAGGAKS